MKAILKTNTIVTQKKPQQNAEASTTTTMMSELWSVGRWYTPFILFVSWSINYISVQSSKYWSSTHWALSGWLIRDQPFSFS